MDPFAGIFFTDNNFNSWSHSISKALEVMKMMKRTPWKQQNAAEFAHFVKTDTKKNKKNEEKIENPGARDEMNSVNCVFFFCLAIFILKSALFGHLKNGIDNGSNSHRKHPLSTIKHTSIIYSVGHIRIQMTCHQSPSVQRTAPR